MNWLLLRGLGREQRHWYEFPERLRELVAPEPVFLLDLAGMGTEHERLPLPSVRWLARDVARRAVQLTNSGGHGNKPEAWSLIGLSLGGMVALELCWLWGQRVARAIVINSSSNITSPLARLQPSALRGLGSALITRDPLARESRVLELTSELPAPARRAYAERSAALATRHPPTRAAFFSQLCAAARFAPPSASSLSAQLCFLGSRRDRLVHPVCSRDLARRYAAPFLEHPWAGHDLALDDPAWICQRVARVSIAGPLSPECHSIGSHVKRGS
jgi:pimeloyl-ACP methyl ester carboxylesterase